GRCGTPCPYNGALYLLNRDLSVSFSYLNDSMLGVKMRIPVYPDSDSGSIRTVCPETSGHLARC
ncbi:MAG: hypothetical protein R6U35_01105, partial [Candidatus Humimicrobiaceae bacterium]